LNKDVDVTLILNLFCKYFEKHYLHLKGNKFDLIKEEYLKHFFRLNNWMDFEIEGLVKTLLIMGVSVDGLLWLKDSNERSIYLDVKQVKWLY
jgi:biotin-(acetyl-CoA carboxylase) ligase